MTFCVPKHLVSKLKNAITDGTLHPDKLRTMDSAKRRELFAKYVDVETAKGLNLAFEQKLLLKNEELAMVSWARDALGLSKDQKAATLDKIQATYAEKKRRVFTPEEDEAFLNEITADVFSRKYKTDVSLEEAQIITELSRDVSNAREKMTDDFKWGNKSEADRIKYGREFGAKQVLLDRYINGLKAEAEKSTLVNPLKEKGVYDKYAAVKTDTGLAVNFVLDNTRAIQASWDNSFWGRQGFKVMTNPKYADLWAKNFARSFIDAEQIMLAGIKKGEAFKGAGIKKGEAIIDAVKADIYSRENYLNGRYEMGTKLAVGVKEEEFPTSLPQKIPLLGRLFSASETAYQAGAMRLRVDIADRLYEIAAKQGIDLNDKTQVGAINQLVNSLTGRGELPTGESWNNALNKTFFSPKNVKSNLDFLLLQPFGFGRNVTKFTQKQAGLNLLSTLGSVGVVLGLANTLWPDSVELDSRSSDFGKIKIGNTRFDVTGGLGSYVVLLSRFITGETKSTTTGLVTKKGEKYGTGDKMDFFWDFAENKFSPALSLAKTLWLGTDFKGEPISRSDAVLQALLPIPASNAYETLKDPKAAPFLVALIADSLGFGTSTYGPAQSEAEKLFEEILELPSDEQALRIEDIKANDPELYKELQQAEKEYTLGVTPLDKALSKMGIENSERAIYIYGEVEKLKTAEEKNAYIDSLVKKRIIILDKTKDGKETGSGWEVYKQLEKIRDAGGVEEYKMQSLSTEDYVEQRGTFGLVSDYTKAFFIDPENAWKSFVGPEKLGKVYGNLVEMQRFYGLAFYEPGGSTERKAEFMEAAGIPWEEHKKYELDHIVPQKAGGDTSNANLQLITKELHDYYTPVDGMLIDAVQDGIMTREDVEKLEQQFKIDKTITAEEVEIEIEKFKLGVK